MKNNNGFNYEISDVFSTEIDLVCIYAIYYILDGMEAILSRKELQFIKSCELLCSDIKEYKHFIATKLAQAIRDYTILVCFAESRYVDTKINDSPFVVKNKLSIYHYDLATRSAFNNFRLKACQYSVWSIVYACKKVFNDYTWEHSYGGPLWGGICDLIYKYDTMTPEEYIDHCIDIHHNSGIYLNKGAGIFNKDVKLLREFLDTKRYEQLYAIIINYMNKTDYNTNRFIGRFYNLMRIYKKYLNPSIQDQIQQLSYISTSVRKNLSHPFKLSEGNKNVFNLERYQPKIFGEKDYGEEFKSYYWYRTEKFGETACETYPFDKKLKYFKIAMDKYYQHH